MHLLVGSVAVPALAATPCEQLKNFRLEGYVVEIDNAQQVAAGPMTGGRGGGPGAPAVLPAHCKVDGTIDIDAEAAAEHDGRHMAGDSKCWIPS